MVVLVSMILMVVKIVSFKTYVWILKDKEHQPPETCEVKKSMSNEKQGLDKAYFYIIPTFRICLNVALHTWAVPIM